MYVYIYICMHGQQTVLGFIESPGAIDQVLERATNKVLLCHEQALQAVRTAADSVAAIKQQLAVAYPLQHLAEAIDPRPRLFASKSPVFFFFLFCFFGGGFRHVFVPNP